MKAFAMLLTVTFIFFTTFAFPEDKMHEHWAYTGESGPDHWASLSPEYAACGAGKTQSPVDISTKAVKLDQLEDIAFRYTPASAKIINNGHTIQVNFPAGNSIELDGTQYQLLQFHFHAPSEHKINGKSYPLEMHLVHKSAEGTLAVVGVMFEKEDKDEGGDEGSENEVAKIVKAYGAVLSEMPAKAGEEKALAQKINPADLLPEDHSTFRYSGSLTTPPCSEGVRWNVLAEEVELTPAQISAFVSLYSGNNRTLQPLQDRSIIWDQEDN